MLQKLFRKFQIWRLNPVDRMVLLALSGTLVDGWEIELRGLTRIYFSLPASPSTSKFVTFNAMIRSLDKLVLRNLVLEAKRRETAERYFVLTDQGEVIVKELGAYGEGTNCYKSKVERVRMMLRGLFRKFQISRLNRLDREVLRSLVPVARLSEFSITIIRRELQKSLEGYVVEFPVADVFWSIEKLLDRRLIEERKYPDPTSESKRSVFFRLTEEGEAIVKELEGAKLLKFNGRTTPVTRFK